ncbi:MAG: hypothetical protein FJ096_14445 [Deltaproteobacteria bacterium]|nr:hypothetical protein [Deltaproteobacteria bacterium]
MPCPFGIAMKPRSLNFTPPRYTSMCTEDVQVLATKAAKQAPLTAAITSGFSAQ